MLKLNKFTMLPVLGFLALALLLPPKTQASDLDIFGTLRNHLQPNVLIILDLSGSMNDRIGGNNSATRLNVAKEVLLGTTGQNAKTGIIDKYKEVRWGLMTFYNSKPGKVIAPCTSRTDLTSFKNTIKNTTATGGTPLATSLAEAGLYFAGQKSFFNSYSDATIYKNGAYISPTEHVCQKSYIILVTDGAPSVDTGTKSGSLSWNNRGNNIFLQDNYISGLDDNDKSFNRPIRNYISDKESELGLGFLISSNDFIYTSSLERGKDGVPNYSWNDSRSFSASSTSYYPAFTNVNELKNLVYNEKKYTWGYNQEEPSIPYPEFVFSTGGSWLSGYYPVFDWANYGYQTITISSGNIHRTQIARGDMYGAGTGSSDYLDDVAAFLYNEDLMPGFGWGRYMKQNIKTYVIGLQIDIDLLKRTAVQGGTGIEGYLTTEDEIELDNAFVTIMESIMDDMATFASPAVPTPTDTEILAGDKIYMSFFKPTDALWEGNLKRFSMINGDTSHLVYQSDEEGYRKGEIRADITSDWSALYNVAGDGADVTKGGARAALNWQFTEGDFKNEKNEPSFALNSNDDLRRVYTYMGSNKNLTATVNSFRSKNTAITDSVLAITKQSPTTRDKIIPYVRGLRLGAIVHSTPAIIYYSGKEQGGASGSVVYVGANDGMLHAIDDTNGRELWAFIMPEHLPTLQYSVNESLLDERYYVDGPVEGQTIEGEKVLLFGARRGGNTYVALDVTDYNAPKFMYQIENSAADNNMGQSWGKANFMQVHATATSVEGSASLEDYKNCIYMEKSVAYTKAASVKDRWIAVLPGGYDNKYELQLGSGVSNPRGVAVGGFSVFSGAMHNTFSKLNKTQSNIMQHSVMDVAALDLNNDSLVDTMYFGDMGGNLFYVIPYKPEEKEGDQCEIGNVKTTKLEFKATTEFYPYMLFKEPVSAEPSAADLRKIMYAPDVVLERDGHYIYVGTGDRETPLDDKVQNRFYCIKNKSAANGGLQHLEDGKHARLKALEAAKDFVKAYDVPSGISENIESNTNNFTGANDATINAMGASKGWYINLRESEKVVSSPVIFNGTVFFTTYIPSRSYEELPENDDLCRTGSTGKGYLYAIDYITAGAVMELESGKGNQIVTEVGESMPTSPVIAVFENGVNLFVGVGVGLYQLSLDNSGSMGAFYWSEIF